MKKGIKKSHNVGQQIRDVNNKIQHKVYSILKHLSNLYKLLKIGNILASLLIIIYISQCIYHLSLNGFSMWYLAEVLGLGSIYITLSLFCKGGIV